MSVMTTQDKPQTQNHPSLSPHTRRPDSSGSTLSEDEDKDPYDLMLERSGCSQYHYKLQDCFFENDNDWRKCQNEMKSVRDCMMKQQQKKRKTKN